MNHNLKMKKKLAALMLALCSFSTVLAEEPAPTVPTPETTAAAEETAPAPSPVSPETPDEGSQPQASAETKTEETAPAEETAVPAEETKTEPEPEPKAEPETETKAEEPPAEETELPVEEHAASGESFLPSASAMDLGETLMQAGKRLQTEAPSEADNGMPLQVSDAVARYAYQEGADANSFIHLYHINGRPAYCLEPHIANALNGGPVMYEEGTWDALSDEDREMIRRYAYAGYGNPMTGDSEDVFTATQMLIWQISAPQYYPVIEKTLKLRDQGQTGITPLCSRDASHISQLMDDIRFRAENFNMVPSFASAFGVTRDYGMQWGKTLELEDKNNVLSWFDLPETDGIELKAEGNSLQVTIKDLYYDGYSLPQGTPLVFRRKDAVAEEGRRGAIIYTSGTRQKLFAESGIDPVEQFTMSFHLAHSDIEIHKQDEFGNAASGSTFALYLDEAGKQPLMHDGKPLLLTTDAEGNASLHGVLPAETQLYLKETAASADSLVDSRMHPFTTGKEGTTGSFTFTNQLRPVAIDLAKRDKEDGQLLNDASFTLYAVMDGAEGVQPGFAETTEQKESPFDWDDLVQRNALEKGHTFEEGGWLYQTESVDKLQAVLKAWKMDDASTFLSRYQLPEDLYELAEFHVRETLNRHGTDDPSDDTVLDHALQVTRIDNEKQLVEVREKNSAKQLITEKTSPSVNDFRAVSEETGIPLVKHAHLKVKGRIYTVEEETGRGIRVSTDNEYTVDLSDPRPCAADLAGMMEEGKTIVLAWSDPEKGRQEASFLVEHSGLSETTLKLDEETYTIAMPAWMLKEDEPKTSIVQDDFLITNVTVPVYEVGDNLGNRYEVSPDYKTELLQKASDADPSKAVFDGDIHDISYEDIIGGKEDGSGTCVDPFRSAGCPVGLVRERKRHYEETISFELPSWDEIIAAEGQLTFQDTVFQVESVDEEKAVLLFKDGRQESVGIVHADGSTKAVHVYDLTVVYTVEKTTDRMVEMIWRNRYDHDGNPIVHRTAQIKDGKMSEDFPLAYEMFEQLEKERGTGFHQGDSFSMTAEAATGVHSSFTMDGHSVVIASDEPHTLLVSLDRNPDASAQEVLDGSRTGSRFATKNGMASITGQYGRQLFVEAADGKQYRYEYLLDEQKKKTVKQFTVAKQETLTWKDLETAMLRNKEKGDRIRIKDKEYRIEDINEESCTLVPYGSLKKIVIPSTKAEELELDMETVREAELVLQTGRKITLKEKEYTIRLDERKPGGRHVRLMDSGRNLIDLQEKDTDPSVLLLFLKTGEKENLAELVSGEKFELRENTCGAVIENGTVSSGSDGTAVLLAMDKDGNVISRTRLIFGREKRQLKAVPVFAGTTGRAYLHVWGMHGKPLSNEVLTLYEDKNCTRKLQDVKLDESGTADVSGLGVNVIYWHDPSDQEIRSMNIEPAQARQGQLVMEGLLEGRSYVLLETGMPEGYEHADGAARILEAHGDKDQIMHVQADNTLRRVSISVVKVDQDNQSQPLDGAWFTAEDVTGLKEGADERRRRIRLSDIPEGSASGDVITIWRSAPSGKKILWKIQDVTDTQVILQKEENGTGSVLEKVSKDGWKEGEVMLYSDILREAEEVKPGVSFSLAEKEDAEFIRSYQILSVHQSAGKDVFGNDTDARVVNSALVVDADDEEAKPVFVDASSDRQMEGSVLLGEFVSGGILIRKTEKKPSLPVSWQALMDASHNNPQKGAVLHTEDGTFTVREVNRDQGKLTGMVVQNEEGEWMIPVNAVPVNVEVPRAKVQVTLMNAAGKQIAIKETDSEGRCLFENLQEGDYVVYADGEKQTIHAGPGIIAVPSVKYGHSIRICETKSPLGHMIGEACTVFVPHGDSTDTVKNFRTNAKVTTVQKTIVRRVKKRKMGAEE